MSDDPQAEYAKKFALRGMQTTDVIAFRCAAEILSPWIKDKRALDVGCGAGRSTEFLGRLGAIDYGVDHNPAMIEQARALARHEPKYDVIADGGRLPANDGYFDLIFSSWMLLEMSNPRDIIQLLKECRRVLKDDGRAVFIVNTAEFYAGDWVSIDIDFPENRAPLQDGQIVKARLLPEDYVVTDYYWDEKSYRYFFTQSNFAVQKYSQTSRPRPRQHRLERRAPHPTVCSV
ncbi:class I SAM-dependent methyltransferase [Cerasicoccus frondis]|uniref:class I SAM-dependent methyltransferase n=1 Tax=Cerasicoccus frondis TaxID=490090 RepID=UPI002852AD91|nr:class I SAM-dependent methyltransferase [Cerasicoccus frondis]